MPPSEKWLIIFIGGPIVFIILSFIITPIVFGIFGNNNLSTLLTFLIIIFFTIAGLKHGIDEQIKQNERKRINEMRRRRGEGGVSSWFGGRRNRVEEGDIFIVQQPPEEDFQEKAIQRIFIGVAIAVISGIILWLITGSS